ncbi:hypothetical protein ACFR97_04845 [Haloplanus litoreus]|uniref:Uncharacterized protein n=1 Tax=Haloplanus litoreus TaxID=767515 RepID=A0ABD6A0G7_9EURY
MDVPSEGATSSHSPGRAERVVAAALGHLLPTSEDGTLVTVYLTLFSLPFATVLLRSVLVI